MRNNKDQKARMNLQTRAHLLKGHSSLMGGKMVNPLCTYGTARKYFNRFDVRSKYDGAYTLKNLSDGYAMLNPSKTISKSTKPVTH